MTIRDWATPLTAGAFLLSAVTGVLIFFHLDTELNKPAHEWLSWALLIGAGAHVTANFTAMKRYFAKPLGLGIIGVMALVMALSFIPTPGGAKGKPPYVQAAEAVLAAPLSVTAQLTKQELAPMLARLQAAGLTAAAPEVSLAQISGPDRDARMRALAIALGR